MKTIRDNEDEPRGIDWELLSACILVGIFWTLAYYGCEAVQHWSRQ